MSFFTKASKLIPGENFLYSVYISIIMCLLLYLISRTGLESEEIVSEMVHGFLLPEVQKKTMRDKGN